MVCTYCGHETQVINSRLQKRSNSVWRRRRCTNCQSIFTTVEQIDYEKSWTVAYVGQSPKRSRPVTAPFLRDKLLVSVHNTLGHRPNALQDALGLTHTIVGKLGSAGAVANGLVTSTAIATVTLDVLKRFDKTGATVYQAYHADVL